MLQRSVSKKRLARIGGEFMVEFFIALFGGLYLTARWIKESSDEEAFAKHQERSINISKMLWGDGSEEREIRSMLRDDKQRMPLLNQISDELTEVFGDNWIEAFECDWCEKYGTRKDFSWQVGLITNPYDVALHILLSHQGRIEWLSTTGYQIWRLDFRGEAIKALQIVERNLREHYPSYDLQLIFVPHNEVDRHGKLVFDDALQRGEIEWSYHIIYSWVRKYKVPVKRLW